MHPPFKTEIAHKRVAATATLIRWYRVQMSREEETRDSNGSHLSKMTHNMLIVCAVTIDRSIDNDKEELLLADESADCAS
jgi:hypothetical protein